MDLLSWPSYAAVFGAGYLCGAVPYGVLVARMHGVDIFKVGSGNPGATNVKRTLGSRAGYTVFALDFLKGLAPVLAARAYGGWCGQEAEILGLIAWVAATLGHVFSPFIGFRGGKGIATGGGGFCGLASAAFGVGLAVWIGLFLTTRFVSVASIAAAFTLPVGAALFGYPWWVTAVAAAIAGFVLWTHRSNLRRLANGTEPRSGRPTPGS